MRTEGTILMVLAIKDGRPAWQNMDRLSIGEMMDAGQALINMGRSYTIAPQPPAQEEAKGEEE